jgi:hypothetical protein
MRAHAFTRVTLLLSFLSPFLVRAERDQCTFGSLVQLEFPTSLQSYFGTSSMGPLPKQTDALISAAEPVDACGPLLSPKYEGKIT